MPLLAKVEACVRVGFLPGVYRLLLEALSAQCMGFLSLARVLAMVFTAFAMALARLIAVF